MVLLVGLTACRGPISSGTGGPVRDRIELTAHAVAGSSINGQFIVINPGGPIDLNLSNPNRCQPGFQVFLRRGDIGNAYGFTEPCLTGVKARFIIQHGTNRLRFRTGTKYTSCAPPSGTVGSDTPRCLAPGNFPDLPPGTYQAVIEWNGSVPLPRPAPVPVTLTKSKG
jgi:hypothetical protein